MTQKTNNTLDNKQKNLQIPKIVIDDTNGVSKK